MGLAGRVLGCKLVASSEWAEVCWCAPVKILSAIVFFLLLTALGYSLMQLWVLHRSSRGMVRRPATGADAFVGSDVEVIESFHPRESGSSALGRVRSGNETWRAELLDGAGRLPAVGDQVRVVGAAGMTLRVKYCDGTRPVTIVCNRNLTTKNN